VPKGLPVSHRTRSARHLLAMSPDPSSHANAARSIELVLRDGAENDLYARDEARGSLSLFMKRL
ncbi:hypothetical protein, partial [Phaeobacter sp. QD34_24]